MPKPFVISSAYILSLFIVQHIWAISFTPIPSMSEVTAMSSDGHLVAGRDSVNERDGILWSASTDSKSIPIYLNAISNDGSIGIYNSSFPSETGPTSFLWNGIDIYPRRISTDLYSITDNGSTIVGSEDHIPKLFTPDNFLNIYSPGEGQSLGGRGRATDISGDGRVVVGEDSGFLKVWKDGVDVTQLLYQDPIPADLPKISQNGNRAVDTLGFSPFGFPPDDSYAGPVFYDLSSGHHKLLKVPNEVQIYAVAVSNEGRIVGNTTYSANRGTAYIWEESAALPRPIREFLIDGRPEMETVLDGWQLTSINDISADGRTIVGTGINPQGQQQAWFADCTTCEDIIRNSVKIPEVVGGDAIRTEFKPNFDMTLAEAAEHCGFTSFNWIQTIELPQRFTVWNLPRGSESREPPIVIDRDGTPIALVNGIPEGVRGVAEATPILDPIASADSVQVVTWDDYDSVRFSVVTHPGPDEFPYYWNLNSYPEGYGVEDHMPNEFTLSFEDRPSWDNLDVGEYLTFKTALAGVRADGTYETWDGLGSTFTWKSNRLHDRTAVIADGIDRVYFGTLISDAPARLSGGVFDVRLDNSEVPEPASQYLLASAVMVGLIFGQFRRRSSQAFSLYSFCC